MSVKQPLCTWTHPRYGKRVGRFEYHWPSDTFVIDTRREDGTHHLRKVVKGGDKAEWGGWKLERGR